MSQPVNLSDQLVGDAQAVASLTKRSISSQIEIWAGLGKAIEPLLRGDSALLSPMTSDDRALSQRLSDVDTAQGRARVEATLSGQAFPHYKPVAGRTDVVRRIEADGSETVGRFVGRKFEPIEFDQ